MTPGARVAAAIEVLDTILDGVSAEQALSRWGRAHRFAGAKDRAAIRDHVFEVLRRKASCAWVGGAMTGRGLMLGLARFMGKERAWFSGEGYAPDVPADDEAGQPIDLAPDAVKNDLPTWLVEPFRDAAGPEITAVTSYMQSRGPVSLRVNTQKTDIAHAQTVLDQDEIEAVPVPGCSTALRVTRNARRLMRSRAYLEGLVELQDVSSQRAMLELNVSPEMRVLDYCAGGGGKSLALAALGARVTAHDINADRMTDLLPRALRAGAKIEIATRDDLADRLFDVVLCDAPCSGSGTWRRTPEAKWALTPERLDELVRLQSEILKSAHKYLKRDGHLVYATCSILTAENESQASDFQGNSGFASVRRHRWLPDEFGDGFYLEVFCQVR